MEDQINWRSIRTIMETPILNERQWGKLPEIPADACLIDLEDTVPDGFKDSARKRAIHYLNDPGYFRGRPVITRCNSLHSPWGRKDLEDLAVARADVICYPKIETADELYEATEIAVEAGHQPKFLVMIETARGLLELDNICRAPGVVGLHFGYIDYAADAGVVPWSDGKLNEAVYNYPRAKISLAAAAYGLFCTSGTLVPDVKDLESVACSVRGWAEVGYSGFICVLPSHVPIVNDLLSPTEAEVANAHSVCDEYEEAATSGKPAIYHNGKLVTAPDYRLAKRLLERHARLVDRHPAPLISG